MIIIHLVEFVCQKVIILRYLIIKMKRNFKLILVVLLIGFLLLTLLTAGIFIIKSLIDINQLRQQISELRVQITPTGGPTTEVTPSTSSNGGNVPINNTVTVYFSKNPDSYTDSGTVVGVDRTNTTSSAYVFAVNQLLTGPTAAEQATGLFLPFTLSGASNCGGAGYTLQKTDNNIFLTFCKTLTEKFPPSGGTAGATLQAESRVLNVLSKTLKISGGEQLSIRNADGACYGLGGNGESNLNSCVVE
jgi:uncharacterized membrane protein YciS (DUF1049 family)